MRRKMQSGSIRDKITATNGGPAGIFLDRRQGFCYIMIENSIKFLIMI